MKDRHLTSVVLLLALASIAADTPTFAGEYADKKLLNGKAVFQMSIEGSGNNTRVCFSAVNNDGSGAAPEAEGTGKVTGKGTLEFKFEDNFKNSGTGTIQRSGEDIIVSLKTTRVADARCLQFYGQNMRLKRVKR
jgi:hypothetical protein